MRRLSMLRLSSLFTLGLAAGGVVALVVFSVVPHHALATTFSVGNTGGSLGLGTSDLKQTVVNIIKWALGFVSLVAVAYMIYGGYLWLTAAGNEQRVEKAKQVILQAAIGMVIIIIAWAIVLFVVKTSSNVTGLEPPCTGAGCTPPPCPLCTSPANFNLTAITSCAAAPNYSQDVPRSSAISLTFNTDVTSASVQSAVTATDDLGHPKLKIEFCGDDSGCASPSTPKPVDNQVFSGTAPTAAPGSTKAEWVANTNTITFYHLSFSTDTANPDNRYFEANKFYRVTIPRNTASTALQDIRSRVLQHCQQDSGAPILGDGFIGEHCQENTDGTLIWTFKTGSDTAGPALQVASTQPSSTYLVAASNTKPDRNVPRNAALNVTFNGAVDPASVKTSNFEVFAFTAPPNPNDGTGGTVSATPLDPNSFDIRVSPDGNGAWLQLHNTLFDSFTWYKVVVQNISNLCGTAMQGQYSWVFETNDASPGVAQVYPSNNFANACPTTKVFIEYNTSMWRVGSGSFDCSPNAAGSYVTDGSMSPTPPRTFNVVDQFDPNNPFTTCKIYSFTPESAGLTPGTTYHVGVNSDLGIDVNGTKLNYGDTPPAATPSQGPWSFAVTTPDKCYQVPVITKVLPPQGEGGSCVSVLGDYFLKPSATAPGPNDKLTLGSANQTVPNGAWNEQSIVSKVQAGSLTLDAQHPYQVKVDYGSPIGVLSSNTVNFQLNSGTPANGICLYSLDPNQGQISSTTAAHGEGFGTYAAGQSVVSASQYPLPAGWPVSSPTTNWQDTDIKQISVAPGTGTGQNLVQIQQGPMSSNPVPFDVIPPVTGVPAIEENTTCNIAQNIIPSPNPQRGDTNVCQNVVVTARFTLPMDTATLNAANITLRSCTNTSTCTGLPPYTVTQNGNQAFTLTPTGGFAQNTLYEVTVGTGVHADIVSGGKALAAPYSWQFTTSDAATCQVAGVTINQSNQTFRQTPYSVTLPATLVDAQCRVINAGNTSFAWSITPSPHVADLQTGNTTANNTASDPQPGPPDVGTASVKVTAGSKTSGPVDITYNPTACTSNAQCATNAFGEACTNGAQTSTCVNNQCTPIVTGFEPDNGAIGTWTTIKGCWFGGYDAAKSKVTFLGANGPADDQIGLDPNTNICGSAAATWQNERIVREVPKLDAPTNDPSNDAVTGPIQVTRSDNATATSVNSFTVNTTIFPGVCRLTPDSGKPNSPVTVTGLRFGPDEPAKRTAQDQVNITKIGSGAPPPAIMTTYTAWTDTLTKSTIDTIVPAGALVGPSEVRVKNDGVSSNPWPYTVLDPNSNGPGSCPAADQCTGDGDPVCGAGRGCGSDLCCHVKPTIVSFQPAQNSSNICRNTVAQVTFSTPLDSSTVNSSTVRYLDGARLAQGGISLSTTANQSTISYAPGLLGSSTPQQLILSAANAVAMPVDNPSFETADASNVPTNWPNISQVKQSTDVPPGHSGFSALGDCSACTGGQQTFIAQNIAGTSAPNITYHVSGWVKVEMTGNSTAGFITRCSVTGNGCSYDLGTASPSLFTNASSGGWVKFDEVIKKTQANSDLITLDCFANPGAKIWCDDVSVTQEAPGPTLLRSDKGVLADISGSPLKFTTGPNICTLDHVAVMNNAYLLTAVNQTANPTPIATAYPSGSQTAIQNIPGVYSWDWSWLSGNPPIATVNMNAATQNTSASSAVVTAIANGKTTAQATAKVNFNILNQNDKATRTGQADISVDVCDNPWDTDGAGPLPPGAYVDSTYHFSLFYCRGQNGSTLLPNFDYNVTSAVSQDPTQLHSYFFKESATSRDTIGILIFKNPTMLSPYDWFIQRFPTQTGASSTTVSGYPAVRTGTTTYIGVTDTDNNGNNPQGLMFVFDYNSNNASSTTKEIFDQMTTLLQFNTNVNSAIRTGVLNDTKRAQDLTSIKVALENYKALHGAYPTLTSGSYLSGYSTSTWPSWQATLGSLLNKSLPTDPVNGFSPACPNGSDSATCWNDAAHAFQCPANSHIYLYHSDGTSYTLFGHMETSSFASTGTVGDACTGQPGSSCSCFNYSIGSP